MALNIVKADVPLEISHIQVMSYGAPGVRKTSIACSSERPLLVNFDSVQNALKAFGRPDSVHVVAQRPNSQQQDWESLRKMSKDELGDYKTLVIDTAGRMIDCIGAYVEGRLGIPPSATFRYYGEIKQQALSFFALINGLGLDIVFVAHEKNEEIRKKTVVSPMIAGGSGGEIYRDCVAIGYMSATARGRYSLDFEPDDSRVAKNCGLPEYEVPQLELQPNFLAGVVAAIKSTLIKEDENAVMERAEVAMVQGLIESGDVNGAVLQLSESTTIKSPSVKRLKAQIHGKAKALGLEWRETQYVKSPNLQVSATP